MAVVGETVARSLQKINGCPSFAVFDQQNGRLPFAIEITRIRCRARNENRSGEQDPKHIHRTFCQPETDPALAPEPSYKRCVDSSSGLLNASDNVSWVTSELSRSL